MSSKSLFTRLWNFLFSRNTEHQPQQRHPREALAETLRTLDADTAEAETAFSDFLISFRQSEAEYQDTLEEKDRWAAEVKSLTAMYHKAQEQGDDAARIAHIHDGMRHAIGMEIAAEKRLEKQQELLKKRAEVRDGLSRSVSALRERSEHLRSTIEELSTRESLAAAQQELYSSDYSDTHSEELEEFRDQVREQESLAIGLKELNSPQRSAPEDIDVELETRLAEELKK